MQYVSPTEYSNTTAKRALRMLTPQQLKCIKYFERVTNVDMWDIDMQKLSPLTLQLKSYCYNYLVQTGVITKNGMWRNSTIDNFVGDLPVQNFLLKRM